jgi:hypothetical protein
MRSVLSRWSPPAVRRLSPILALAASLAVQAPLHAADLGAGIGAGIGAPAGVVVSEDGVVRAPPLVVFDYQPGVTQREYWLTPWDGRHYFPSGGKLPVARKCRSRSRSRPTWIITGAGRHFRSTRSSSRPSSSRRPT